MKLYAKKNGFSLFEMMIVLGVVVFLVSMIVPRVMSMLGRVREEQTRIILSDVNGAVVRYVQDVGQPPHHLKDLMTRPKRPEASEWQGSYLAGKTEIPLDGFKKELYYAAPPRKFKGVYKKYEIYSMGGDEDDDASDRLRVGS